MKKILFLIGLVCLLSGAAFTQTPSFLQYKAVVQKAKVKDIDFRSNKNARTYRTNLRNALKEGVNFAGRFVVATWGCGTNCTETGIIDAGSGKVYFPKELEGAGFGFCDLPDNTEPLVYKSNSRLFILNGFKGGDLESENTKCGIYYFEWTGTALRKIKFVPKKRIPNP